jgi:hypothetical protein
MKLGVCNRICILSICLAAAVITTGSQFTYIFQNHGRHYLVTRDLRRHNDKISGRAPAPFRYRLLTDIVLERLLRASPERLPHKYEVVSFAFRLMQNLGIALLAYLYYRSLGVSTSGRLVGVGLLSYGMCFAFYQSDLSFYTYTELALYLLAAVLINAGRDWTILPLTGLAAFNRESAVFIPVMLLAARLCRAGDVRGFRRSAAPCTIAVLSVCLFWLVHFGLRAFMGPAPGGDAGSAVGGMVHTRYGLVHSGPELFALNALNPRSWIGLAQMYSLTPFALLRFRRWAPVLRSYFFWLAVPWFLAQFAFASADETRLFLVPLAVVFVPAVLAVVAGTEGRSHEAGLGCCS